MGSRLSTLHHQTNTCGDAPVLMASALSSPNTGKYFPPPKHKKGEEKIQSTFSTVRTHSSTDIGEGKRKYNLLFQVDGIALEQAAAQTSCYADKQQCGQVATRKMVGRKAATRARIVSFPKTGNDFLATNCAFNQLHSILGFVFDVRHMYFPTLS